MATGHRGGKRTGCNLYLRTAVSDCLRSARGIAVESVRVKTGLFCSISEMFWEFLSLPLLAHNVTFVCPPIRHQVPRLWAYECYIMLLPLRN